MAEVFGASGVADAFNFAFIFPNLTRRLFGEGLLTSVFVPVFSGKLAKGEKEAANRTASVLLVRLSYWLSLGCVTMVAVSMCLRSFFAGPLHLNENDILIYKLFEALLPRTARGAPRRREATGWPRAILPRNLACEAERRRRA